MNQIDPTNHSDNKIKLVILSTSSGLAFQHTIKPLK